MGTIGNSGGTPGLPDSFGCVDRSLSSGVFGEPQSFEGARQGVLGQCRLQPDDSNCSTIYVQVDLDRVAAS